MKAKIRYYDFDMIERLLEVELLDIRYRRGDMYLLHYSNGEYRTLFHEQVIEMVIE